jgi:hypothetical protein
MSGYATSDEDRLIETLLEAEETGRIESSLVRDLKILRDDFERLRNLWLENEEDIERSFSMFHASKNCLGILEEMISRFESAHERNENPTVALDAITILPSILDLRTILSSQKTEKLDEHVILSILDKVRSLRVNARRLKMLPSDKKVEEIDLRKSKKGFKILSNSIAGIVSEEQNSC